MAEKITHAELNGRAIATRLADDPEVYRSLQQVTDRYDVTPKQWVGWCRCGLVPAPVLVAGELRWSIYTLVEWEWQQAAGGAAWDCYLDSVESVDVTRLDKWGNGPNDNAASPDVSR